MLWRYSQDLEAINRIGRELGSAVSRDIEKIGELIDEQISQVIPSKNFFLCIYDEDRDHFSVPYIRDEHDTRETLEPELHAGLTGYVCRTGKPLFGDLETKRQLFAEGKANSVGHPAAIWLGTPLVVRDKAIGALVVQDYSDESTFGRGHLHLLEAIASQAASAIDNYRLLEDSKHRLKELSALLQLSQEFGERRLSSTDLLSSILNSLCQLAACDGSLVLLVDTGDPRCFKVAAASERLVAYKGKSIGRNEGVAGLVARTLVPQIINNYAEWPERNHSFDPAPQKVCAVPLEWQGELIGVMTLSSDSKAGKFSQREVEILQRFAGPATMARDSSLRQALIKSGPNAIVAVDGEGRIMEFNQEAEKLFKRSPVEVIGKSVTMLYWSGLEGASKIGRRLSKEGKLRGEEIFGVNSDHEKIPISISAALLKDDAGNALGSVGILEDLRLQSLRGRPRLLVDALREISNEDGI